MKVVRYDNEGPGNYTEYETSNTNIREIAMIYGHAYDTIELYDDDDNLVAIATWPQGSKVYMYCYGKNLNPNPCWRLFIY